jgi:hypothetical protein
MTAQKPTISRRPLFEKDVFANNPALFAPFFRNTPAHLVKKHQAAKDRLPEFEKSVQWSMVEGQGFCGATHPGAGKSFNGIMTGTNYPIYDSDCIYINPHKRVFAISDSPGMTTFSRRLFQDLDRRLKAAPDADMACLINGLNHNTQHHERATLTLIDLDNCQTPAKAQAFIAGDTFLFHGNRHRKQMVLIKGQDAFMGRFSGDLEPIEIDLGTGDFFIIASDGITDARSMVNRVGLEQTLLNHLNENLKDFVANVIERCNRIREDTTPNGNSARFCGNDDISLLIVLPENIPPMNWQQSCLLGGYITG